MQRASSSALVVSGWHRMSYSFATQRSETLQELEKCVRKIHSIAKNAITDGKYIVFGAGSTQLILAAVYALSFRNSSFPAQVFASAPNYPLYKMQLDYFKTDNFEFEGDTSMLKNNSDALNVIEFVTSPNNPDGKLKNSVLLGPSVSTIYDRAYYWPHYTAIPAPADEDVMMFTISKLTGHAGSRFGWAIVKDKCLYERMLEYIEMSELDLAKDTALRALKLLQVITYGNGRQIFDFAYNTMRNRWEKLSHVISLSNRFSLQDISPQYCNFFNNVRGPSPAYAWLKCEREEDRDCIAIFKAAKINVNSGKKYNAETHFVRLSLLQAEDDFSWLLHRFNQLIKNEVGAAAAM